VTLKSHPAVR